MPRCFLTLGAGAPLPELRRALQEVCPFSEAGAAPPGPIRGAFPQTDALLVVTIDDGEGTAELRSARGSLRRWRRSEAKIRGIVAHLAPRFGDVRFCVQHRYERSGPKSVGRSAPMGLEDFLASERGLPDDTLLTVRARVLPVQEP